MSYLHLWYPIFHPSQQPQKRPFLPYTHTRPCTRVGVYLQVLVLNLDGTSPGPPRRSTLRGASGAAGRFPCPLAGPNARSGAYIRTLAGELQGGVQTTRQAPPGSIPGPSTRDVGADGER